MSIFRRKNGRSSPLGLPTPAAVVAPVLAVAKGPFRRLSLELRLAIGVPIAGAIALTAFLGGMFVHYTLTFPDPLTLRHRERAPVVRILARDGSVLAERGAAADFMPLDLLPPLVINAVVATEDRRFREHRGLDPIGLLRASFANLRAGRFAQGGSTLTQQLAKNLFLSPERTMSRKLEELVLALWLEMRLSKTDILELYLNRVYFGGGAYGIEAASQRFFDKSARELTIAEAAVIAGLLKAPSKYSPISSPIAARARGRVVLSSMLDAGVITKEQEQKARAETVNFAGPRQSSETTGAEYAVDFVLERLPPLVGSGHAEVIVETTIDAGLQRRANEIVNKELVLQGSVMAASQAALVVLDTDGGIRALVGGRSYTDSQFNRAVKARRQPGSAFKPFVYLAALESGLTPDSTTYDLPISIKGWAPRNFDGRYTGAVTLRHALAQSINTVAVRLILDIGAQRVVSVARRLGIHSELRDDPSLALGTSEVSMLELAGAYGAFGNGGREIEPHAIRRVRMSSGRVLYARPAADTAQAIAPQYVGAMNDMLNAAMTQGTGKRAAIPLHPAAGKTGTSQDFRDAWFVGYTAHLTAAVWVGNDNGQMMDKVRGGNIPAEIWNEVMRVAHQGKAPLALPGTLRASTPRPEPVGRAEPLAPVAAVRDSETLPWLAAHPDPVTETAALPNAASPAQPASHPQDRIDEDFIARALSGQTAIPNRLAGAPAESSPPQERVNGRIIVRPPPGMMSLGNPLSDENDGEPAEETGPSKCSFFGLFC